VLALLGVLGYFSFQAAQAYLRWRAIRHYSETTFKSYPPSGAELDQLLPELKEKVDRYGGDTLRVMYMDLLMLHSWYRPQTSVDDLREALALGQDLYTNGDVATCYMVRQLSYGYTAACLPAKLERWQAEVLAREPQSRHYIRFFQVYGRIISDEPQRARDLIAKELESSSQDYITSVLALSGYLLLDDLDSAAMYAPLVEEFELQDNLFQYYYALFLQRQGNFQAALDRYRAFMGDNPSDPDDALAQAVPLAALNGLDDPQVIKLLNYATESTRNPASRQAVEAMVSYQLYEITREDKWRSRLRELRAAAPEDCQVAIALAYALMLDGEPAGAAANGSVTDIAGGENGAAPAAGNATGEWEALQVAQNAYQLAQSKLDKQQSSLLLAIIYADPHAAGSAPVDKALAESARFLRLALGDPHEPDAVDYQRVPDYEYFIMDKQVQAARQTHADYDVEVHHAVIDYLNRRQQLFAGVVDLPPLEYRDSQQEMAAVQDL
jgi:hypothetical protein